jgi:G3E family GTPase
VNLLTASAAAPETAGVSGRRPVTLLSGFLGSGKTTLLRHRLNRPHAAVPSVILNDFGSTLVDDVLLGAEGQAPLVVSGGCACCTRRDELASALAELLDAEQRGRAPRRDSVVIETSGLSDPGPIAFTIAHDPVLKHHYALARVCVTVDALTGAEAAQRYDVALRQLLAADDVFITKADLVAPEAIEELITWIRAVNPSATVSVTASGELLREVVPSAFHAPAAVPAPPVPAADARSHVSDIATLELTSEEPLDWQALSVWLTLLLHRHGTDVLRVKGVLDVRGTGPVAVNGVQHVVHAPEHLRGPVPLGTRLVLIVRGLDTALLERSYHAFIGIDRKE